MPAPTTAPTLEICEAPPMSNQAAPAPRNVYDELTGRELRNRTNGIVVKVLGRDEYNRIVIQWPDTLRQEAFHTNMLRKDFELLDS